MFDKIFEGLHSIVPPRKNLYAEYWRWVIMVLDLAEERDIPPTELLALEEANDEIARRMFTKKQFRALSEQAINKTISIKTMKKTLVEPMLDMEAGNDKERRLELEQEIEKKIMPKLLEDIRKRKEALTIFLEQEIRRIYS